MFSEIDFSLWLSKALSFILPLLKAAIIVAVGHFLIKYLIKLLDRAFGRTKLDESLVKFLEKTADIVLHVLVVISALNAVGVSTTGIIAALSAVAAAVALALKDSLSNIAGGILLLVSPRFATGDCIEVNGDIGTVLDIDMMHTVIRTFDNRHAVIPNGILVNSRLINYSQEPKRRVDLTFTVSYDNDTELAKRLICETMEKHPLVIAENGDEAPFARVSGYGDSAVEITARAWCRSENYWDVHFDLKEQVRRAFDENGITIPYNQLDVHVK